MAVATALITISVMLTSASTGAEPTNTVLSNTIAPSATIEPPGARSSEASAINDVGTVVGRFDDGEPGGFVMTAEGEFETFRIQDAGLIVITDVNDAGITTGYFTVNAEQRGFLRSTNGTFTTVRVPGSSSVQVEGINDAGVAVGHSRAPSGRSSGFLRSPVGVLTAIEVPGAAHTVARAVNDRGDVAGFYETRTGDMHGFVRFADGTLQSFSTPTGGGLSVSAIDEAGNVAGWYADRNEARRAFVRSASDQWVTIVPAGAIESLATDLDDAGRVVGFFRDVEGVTRGFVRSAEGAIAVIEAEGAIATSVSAIGAGGTIVGNVRTEGSVHGVTSTIQTPPDEGAQPAPPRGLEAVPSELAVDLRWVPGDDAAESHQVFRSSDGTLGELIATVGDPSYRDDAAQPGVTYTYAVKSVSEHGESSWRSNFAEIAVGADVDAPVAAGAQRLDGAADQQRPTPPRGLRALPRPWGIELTWNASSDDVGVTEYVIHRSIDGTLGEPWRTVNGDELSFPHGQAEPGVSYTYAVRAVDGAGNLSWRSNLSTATLD